MAAAWVAGGERALSFLVPPLQLMGTGGSTRQSRARSTSLTVLFICSLFNGVTVACCPA